MIDTFANAIAARWNMKGDAICVTIIDGDDVIEFWVLSGCQQFDRALASPTIVKLLGD